MPVYMYNLSANFSTQRVSPHNAPFLRKKKLNTTSRLGAELPWAIRLHRKLSRGDKLNQLTQRGRRSWRRFGRIRIFLKPTIFMVKPHGENPLSEQEQGVLCIILAANPLFAALVSRWPQNLEDSSLKNRVFQG